MCGTFWIPWNLLEVLFNVQLEEGESSFWEWDVSPIQINIDFTGQSLRCCSSHLYQGLPERVTKKHTWEVRSASNLAEHRSSKTCFPSTICVLNSNLTFFNVLADIDGLGSSAIGGQLMASASAPSPLSQNRKTDDSVVAGTKTIISTSVSTSSGLLCTRSICR